MIPRHQRYDTNQQCSVEVDADFEDIIPSFLDNKRGDVVTMHDALNRRDFEEIRKMGHKLKGTSRMYGFEYMSTLCLAIEEAAKNQEADIIRENLDLLADHLDHVIIKYVHEE